MNTKKIIGNSVAVVILLIGIILMGGIRNATGLGANSGISGALIIYSPFLLSIFIARLVTRRIQGISKGSKEIKTTDLLKKGGPAPDSKPDDQGLDREINKKKTEALLTDKAVCLGNFSLEIPEGDEPVDGYVTINHNTKYSIKISNSDDRPCDAKVEVDGKQVGIWRIPSGKSIALERPAHDTGHFTFYKFDSTDAQKAGLILDDNLGLISVLFKPEKPPVISETKFSMRMAPGGTGLSGKSEQKFKDVKPLDYDEAGFVHIHLRLVCKVDEPRPLTAASTPVPGPIQ